MQFIHTSLLFGLLAILIPILIHLFQKQKPKTVPIPTFHFIEQALIESSSSRKIKSSLLLFLRMLLIALPVLLLAQPYLPGVNAELEKKHIIIIDNSYYSAQGQQLQEAKDKAQEIIKNLPEGSMLKLVSVNNYNKEFTYIHEDVIEEVKSLSPNSALIDFNKFIKRLDKKDDSLRFHCISDLNAHAWKNEVPTQDNITFHTLKKRRFNNYIQSLKHPDFFILNQVATFEVILAGDSPLAGLKVHLYEDDQIIQSRTVPLSQSSSISLKFNYTPSSENFKLYFKLDVDDKFQEDNHYYFVGKSSPQKKLFIFDQASRGELSPGLIAQLALEQNSYFEISRSDLHKLSLDGDIYFFSGLSQLKEADWNKIDQLSEMEKIIILWPMDSDDPENLSPRILPIFRSNMSPEISMSRLFSQDAKLKDFNQELADITLPQTFLLERSSTQQSFLNSFDKRDLVSSTQYKKARLVFSGLSVSPELINSNFLAPLIHAITRAQTDLGSYNLSVGQNIGIDTAKALIMSNPEGIKEDIAPSEKFYNKTLISGFYDLSNEQSYAVNLERPVGINSYLDQPNNENSDESKPRGFYISSSVMTLILLIVLLSVNIVELRLTRKESA